MHPHLRTLAARQLDVVAVWQLREGGWTSRMIKHHAWRDGWRRIHRGVYALNSAPLSRQQLWMAATLTSPDSYLSHASAGAHYGFRRWTGSFEVITRPGRAGRRRHDRLLVFWSTTLEGDTTRHRGIPTLSAARVLLELAGWVPEKQTRRAFREALRLKVTDRTRLGTTLGRHAGRPGTPLLGHLTKRYGSLPYARARSDPEGLALEILLDAGIDQPLVNIRVAGEEADLTWPEHKRIIEIDGPQYHRFPEEDARKQARWERAGFTVRRMPSDDVYDHPERLIALAPHR
jgi:uncharacterized protein DUF559